MEFLSLKGGCTGSSESTLIEMPHCWKSHVAAHFYKKVFITVLQDKHKGVEHLIEIENPNRVLKKNKKLNEVDTPTTGTGAGSSLSRREK